MSAAATPVTLGTAGSAQVRQHRATLIRAQASAIRRASALAAGAAVMPAAAIRVTHGTVAPVQATAHPRFLNAARQTPVRATTRQVTSHGRKRLTPPIIGAAPAHIVTI